MWDFSTEPGVQAQVDWVDDTVRNRLEPLQALIGADRERRDLVNRDVIPALQREVKPVPDLPPAERAPEYPRRPAGARRHGAGHRIRILDVTLDSRRSTGPTRPCRLLGWLLRCCGRAVRVPGVATG
jgi:hypothetical protein